MDACLRVDHLETERRNDVVHHAGISRQKKEVMTHGPTIGGGCHREPIEHTHEDKRRMIEEIAAILDRFWAPKKKEGEE
jgi:hypothetical protein